MTIEQSHGKARATLPRSSDLQPAQTAGEPTGQRDAAGHFEKGNALARGAGLKHICRLHAAAGFTAPELAHLEREVQRLYLGFVRELPLDSVGVRDECAKRARNTVLAAWYTALATQRGLGTPEGDKALEMALKLEAASTKHAVFALDLANKLAVAARKRPGLSEVEREYQRMCAAAVVPSSPVVPTEGES